MGKMCNEQVLEELKTEIETKRKELNLLVVEDINKDEVLKFSVELDKLIEKYYSIQLDKK
jgi:diphthamide synthase subunit DPH2